MNDQANTEGHADDRDPPSSPLDTCPSCGVAIPKDSPHGLCPQCLIAGGMTAPRSSGSLKDFMPPSVEELDASLADYHVLEMIGRGGMGAVYKAHQTRLDRVVAIKVLPVNEETAIDPAFAQRFQREAQVMARLSHPNIVTIYDSGETDDGLFYFVMEYVDGPDLQQLIRTRQVTPDQALAIVPQICEALQFAHSQGIVHRDIKPGNILIDKQTQVKVTDFGLVKMFGGETHLDTLTATGTVMGTYNYVAPEQLDPDGVTDHRADIYSLGVVFYELLTGTLPKGMFEPPSRKVQIDVRLDEVVLRAMQERPEKRYQQASEVKSNVESIRDSPSAPPRRPRRAPNGIVTTLIVLASVAFGMIGALWVLKQQEKANRPESSIQKPSEPPITAGPIADGRRSERELAPISPPPLPLAETIEPPAEIDEETKHIYQEALALLKADPEAIEENVKVALEALQRANPRLFELKSRAEVRQGQLEIDLSGNHALVDLTPLRGLPISRLNLSHSLLDDLSPLRGMPLQHLDLSVTEVADLAPLDGMPIQFLNLARTKVRDLTPLDGMPLADLDLSFTDASALGILAGEPLRRLILHGVNSLDSHNLAPFLRHRFLTEINIAGINIAAAQGNQLDWLEIDDLKSVALTPGILGEAVERLREAPHLERIGIWDVSMHASADGIHYLEPKEFWQRYDRGEFREDLAAMEARINQALAQLQADNPEQTEWNDPSLEVRSSSVMLLIDGAKQLTNIEALAELPITHLSLSGSEHLADLSPLKGMPLVSLGISYCPRVRDITPLAHLPLRRLSIGSTKVRDFSPLKGMPLKYLDLTDTPFTGLNDIIGLPLKQLNIGNCTQLVNLSGLERLCVRDLDLQQLPALTSLESLKGMPLTSLNLENCPLTDLNPIRDMPLKVLVLYGTQVADLAPLQSMSLDHLVLPDTNIAEQHLHALEVKQIDFDPSWRNGDWEALQGIKTLRMVCVGGEHPMPVDEFWKRYNAGEWSTSPNQQVDDPANPDPTEASASAPAQVDIPDYVAAVAQLNKGPAAVERQVKEALERLKADNPGINDPTLDLKIGPGELVVDLSGNPTLKDVSALRGLPITHLNANHTAVSDLSPLAGMPIRDLDISHTEIRDVSVLESMPLERLRYDPVKAWNGYGDLWRSDTLNEIGLPDQEDFLQASKFWANHESGVYVKEAIGKALEKLKADNAQQVDWPFDFDAQEGKATLDLSGNDKLADISALKDLPLTSLILNSTKISDLSALQEMPLSKLSLGNFEFLIDLAPLAKLPLIELHLNGHRTLDLSPLKGLQLKSLTAGHASDLTPLIGMPLEWLYIGGNFVDLSPLANMPLKDLTIMCYDTTVDLDFTPLAGLTSLNDLRIHGLRTMESLEFVQGMPLESLDLDQSGIADLRPLANKAIHWLNLNNTNVGDLRGLEGMPLADLALVSTRVSDLSPLKDSKLRSIDLRNSSVTDLTPISKLPLHNIALDVGRVGESIEILRQIPTLEWIATAEAHVKDPFPVAGFWKLYDNGHFARESQIEAVLGQLKRANTTQKDWHESYVVDGDRIILDLGGHSELTNITPIEGLPITELCLNQTKVEDLSPLQGMKLESLEIQQTAVSDISVIKGMPLRSFSCYYADNIKDYSPLRGLPLKYLNLQASEPLNNTAILSGMKLERLLVNLDPNIDIADLSFLAGMSLQHLYLDGNKVTNIEVLKGMPLKFFHLSCPSLRDLSPLESMNIEELNISGSSIKDLRPLKGMPLSHVEISGTNIDDLTPLKDMPIKYLDFGNTAVHDLEPLRAMRLLSALAFNDTYVRDLSPLESVPLETLNITPGRIVKGMGAVREIPSLHTIAVDGNGMPSEEFWKRYDAGEFRSKAPGDSR